MWKFAPILKTTVWGGNRIIPFKGLTAKLSNIGESWEVSGVPGSESVVEEGPDDGLTLSQLIDRHQESFLGKRNYKKFGNHFPLLVKIIDAHQDLSVQVHPDDELARKRGHRNGKAEMWYVVRGGRDVRLANGFNRPIDSAELDGLIERGDIEKVLNYMDIEAGEVFFIPAGRVHALGSGAMVIEIQQTSDVTYRLYDYQRPGLDGKPRELHADLAREAINYNDTSGAPIDYRARMGVPTSIIRTPYFTTNLLVSDSEFMRDYSEYDTFVILVAASGEAEITCGNETIRLQRGNTVVLPADADGITIAPNKKVTLLETYIS